MKHFQAVVLMIALVILVAGAILLQSDVAVAGNGNSGGGCPSGSGCGCGTAYAPVLCGKQKCRYLNSCVARCAGWSSTQCVDGNPN